MKKALLFAAILCLAAGILSAQDYKGKGRLLGLVLDQDDKPLEGVRIKLFLPDVNQGFEVKTGADGRWTAAWIRKGEWNVDFEKIGYEVRKINVAVSESGKNPELKINLKKTEGLTLTDDLKALFEKGDYDGARAAYEGLLQKYPDAYILWKSVGSCWFAQEKYDEAEAAFKKVLEKDAANADALVLVGNCYANRGRNDVALEWYNKVEFEKVKDSTVLYNIGTNYFNLAKYEEALRYYKRAVELKADFTDALKQLGLAYINLQKNPEAIAAFEAYLKIDADSPQAAQVRSFLEYLRKK